mgnify:CR=1 FL=1
MAKKIKLADVAAQANVSIATVSRVLNNASSVALSTRRRVLSALDLLGYERPEKLRNKNTALVGIVTPELTNPIFPEITTSLSDALITQGYLPLIGTQTAGGATEDAYIEALINQNAAGIIFLSGRHADQTATLDRYTRVANAGIPFVTINGANPHLTAPDFSTDNEVAVIKAIKHLTAQGHTRIGLATGPTRYWPAQTKVETFHTELQKFPGVTGSHTATLFTIGGGQVAASQLINQGCTAIICASDVMALGALRYCNTQGLQVPKDISIIGFDDSPLMAFTQPPLTSVHQPVSAIAEAAVNTLTTLIQGNKSYVKSLVFTPELIVRESTGIAPAEDT